MGRHSRRGGSAAAKDDTGNIAGDTGAKGARKGRAPGPEASPASPGPQPSPGAPPGPAQRPEGPQGGSWAPQAGGTGGRGRGAPGPPYGQRGVPVEGPRGYAAPPTADGTPARGVPRFPDGTPARGVPRFPDGTPARGVPRFADGTPAHGMPRLGDGTPAQGTPQVRGGHPQQREAGGGWGEFREPGGRGGGAAGAGVSIPRQRQASPGGPRQDYLDAFEADDDVFAPRSARSARSPRSPGYGVFAHPSEPHLSELHPTERHGSQPYVSEADGDEDDAPPTGVPAQARGAKGRTYTGIAAAAVTTVLAVVVAGQVTQGRDDSAVGTQSATGQARDVRESATLSAPSSSPGVATLTYDQAMGEKYPLSATFKGSGKFDAVPGTDKAPGKGQKYTYRVDVEQGLGLDGKLFAEAVQKTINDSRSWAHDGARTFERVSSGRPDFVITLASPGTTATWCAKSGLDTTEDNVSCDSASTQRVMINAYRWAQGSKTYGDRIHAYRQMLINHEVGHRLGYSHVSCTKNGQLAPVMQQQTKFLDHDGIHCLPNPWPYPGS